MEPTFPAHRGVLPHNAHSNSLWPPDRQYLVFTGRLTSATEGSGESNGTADAFAWFKNWNEFLFP